jgi:hypothetical protein
MNLISIIFLADRGFIYSKRKTSPLQINLLILQGRGLSRGATLLCNQVALITSESTIKDEGLPSL